MPSEAVGTLKSMIAINTERMVSSTDKVSVSLKQIENQIVVKRVPVAMEFVNFANPSLSGHLPKVTA